jgi:hypothetical protein
MRRSGSWNHPARLGPHNGPPAGPLFHLQSGWHALTANGQRQVTTNVTEIVAPSSASTVRGLLPSMEQFVGT